jgi:6-phosphogluconolactonase (cycloisomerase 2 family)
MEKIMAVNLVNTDNVFDAENANLNLNGAICVDAITINGTTFIYVGSPDDDGVSVFEVGAGGTLTNTDNIDNGDDPDLLLDEVTDVITFLVNGQAFVMASSLLENGVTAFAALTNGALVPSDTFNDTGNIFFQLDQPTDLATAVVGGNRFVFAAGSDDDGIEVLQVANDGTLTHVDSVNDAESTALQLDEVQNVATATIGATTFLFAAGLLDDGISVFSVAANGVLTNVDNIDDSEDPDLLLNGPSALATAVVGAKTFLFVSDVAQEGISVFEVAANGVLTNVFNILDDAGNSLTNVFNMTTTTIAGTTYLITASSDDNVSVFAIAADGTLVDMEAEIPILAAEGLSTAVVGGETFLFATTFNAVGAYRIDTTGLTINGTAGNDTIDAVSSAAGELLPSALGDDIFGLAGNDTIDGLGGGDILTGGLNKDSLTGGGGGDFFNYDLIAESTKGANRDVIEDFSRGQGDRIDLSGIDAKTGGGNQAFKFIGVQGFHDQKGELHFVKKAGFVLVEGDVNGDGRADFQIQVEDVARLVAADFVL